MLVEEEKTETSETGTDKVMEQDYLAAIEELKKNSVPRTDYDKVQAENKKLLNSIVNGQREQEQVQKVVHTEEEIKELRRELFNPDKDHTNLDYVTKALELREALIENGQADPFIPVGKQISPTNEDIEIANKVAQVYQECIDYAQGDSELFTQELMRRTRDVRIR